MFFFAGLVLVSVPSPPRSVGRFWGADHRADRQVPRAVPSGGGTGHHSVGQCTGLLLHRQHPLHRGHDPRHREFGREQRTTHSPATRLVTS